MKKNANTFRLRFYLVGFETFLAVSSLATDPDLVFEDQSDLEAVMRIKFLLAVLTLSVFPMFAGSVYAQASLNDIKIEACGTEGTLERLITNEEKRSLVIDARPAAVNQSTGRLSFQGKMGRVSVAH